MDYGLLTKCSFFLNFHSTSTIEPNKNLLHAVIGQVRKLQEIQETQLRIADIIQKMYPFPQHITNKAQ